MEAPAAKQRRPQAWLWIAGGLLIGAAIGAAAWFWFGPGKDTLSGRGKPLPPVVTKIDAPAPDFELRDLQGNPVRLSDLRGKAVALNFWATWCGPCRLEMPLLEATARQHTDELAVLAINFDEPEKAVSEFVNELNLQLPVLLDPGGKVTDLYRVRGFPTTMFIDQQGNLRYQHIGILNQESLFGYLEDLGIDS